MRSKSPRANPLTGKRPPREVVGGQVAAHTPSTSQTAAVYERLRNDLLSCRLRPGQRLNIKELADAMSVSLGAIREALSRLTSEDLVVAEPQRGFRAAPISAADLVDLTRVRIQIEEQCLRRAIAIGSLAWEQALLVAHRRLARTPATARNDPARVAEAWALRHAEFHEAMSAGCDSLWLLRLRRLLFAHSERYRRLSLGLGGVHRRVADEHAGLVAAVLARDADRAVRLLTEHLTTTAAALTQLSLVPDGTTTDTASPARRASLRQGRG